MKKMIFGTTLMICGFIGLITMYVLSLCFPWIYNDIGGFRGFLLGTNSEFIFFISTLSSITGFLICFYETYKKNDKNKE